jgi:hypothetical protein
MLFKLKNMGATYQWCMQFCFKEHIGRNIKVHLNNIMAKPQKSDNLISDLEVTFNNLRQFNIKLNPEKCTFRVPRGKLLWYIINKRGIEANPNKILAITKMGHVRNILDIQQLMWCLIALDRFMSRLGKHELPLYKLLKKSDSFHWTEETQKALDELKALITKPPVLA